MHAWPGLGIVYHPTLAEAGACVLRVITALLIVHQRCGGVLRARAPRASKACALERARARPRRATERASRPRSGLDKLENTDGFAMGERPRPDARARKGKRWRAEDGLALVRTRARVKKKPQYLGVIAEYFPFLVFPYFFTYLAAAVEIVGSFCLAVGIFARPASLLLAGTMMNALAFHLMKFGPQRFPLNPESRGAYTYEPCLAFLGVTLYFAFAGPGKFAMRPHGF